MDVIREVDRSKQWRAKRDARVLKLTKMLTRFGFYECWDLTKITNADLDRVEYWRKTCK